MPDRKRVLITGAAGLVGSLLRQSLAVSYDVSGVDVRPVEGFPMLVADMTDPPALQAAFAGVDLVIDLAAKADHLSDWDDIYANNLPATHNALQAARQAGVQRLIFASSNHVTGMYEGDPPYSDIVAGRTLDLDPSAIPRIHTGDADSAGRTLRHWQSLRESWPAASSPTISGFPCCASGLVR